MTLIDLYAECRSDTQKIAKSKTGESYATLTKPPSDKLAQVYQELVRVCAPNRYIAFLRLKLEPVAGSRSSLKGIRDGESWQSAVLELAV